MNKSAKNILLNREGSVQTQRFIDALDPSSVKLNDFELEDWMKFAYNFAQHVNYFHTSNSEIPNDNWADFFKNNEELQSFLSHVKEGGDITPHLALFVSFVWLMEFPKKRFNNLTKRHLDFYYKDILKIEKLPASSDKVYVLFELAKKATLEKITANTELDGGKDDKGEKRIYETTEEIVVNRTVVFQLRSVYNDTENLKVKAAKVANSFDGQGADFPDEVEWWPFGYYEKEGTGRDREYAELQDAKLGFAVSSHVLKMKEGERCVEIEIEFQDEITLNKAVNIIDNVEIWCTGEKEWLGPFSVAQKLENEKGEEIYSTQLTKKSLKLAFKISRKVEPIVSYKSEIHGEQFNTNEPICRVLIKTELTAGYELYQLLNGKEMNNIKININVEGVRNLILENDIGTLDATKPFYPFGSQPLKGSNFYINYPELFEKKWSTFDMKMECKNTPDSFKELYYAYRNDMLYQASSFKYQEAIFLKKSAGSSTKTIIDEKPKNLIVDSEAYFKANINVEDKGKWLAVKKELKDNHPLFDKSNDGYKFSFTVENGNFETTGNKPLKISSNQSFLHELFQKIYALAISSKDENALIPNQPYTPIAESISMNYTASSELKINASENAYPENEISFFHEHPFGQSEELAHLQNKLDYTGKTEKLFLLPVYNRGGELYIGLDNAEPSQTVSLLIQTLEGSGNPASDSFADKEKVEWFVLCQGKWRLLDNDYMIANNTDNFLKSGIVKFTIPKEVDKNNGLVWLKVRCDKKFDTVSKVIGIHAQAVRALFANNNNGLSHLKNGLEAGTISKLTHRVSSIKKITQPYSSYGGKLEESDTEYYRRISERLRHKNRAVSIWDYEHLVLQQFPNIHKVKCLNHTSEDSFMAPGFVYIVVIPDVLNTNVFDFFQPAVGKATLNKIERFANNLNSTHVKALVRSPDYEEVLVKLKVRFHKGYDDHYYLKMLNEDIIRLLSPWAFRETSAIAFGTELHHSKLVHYIEKLEYVDYIEDVVLKKNGVISTLVKPSNPKSILVSVRQHEIELS